MHRSRGDRTATLDPVVIVAGLVALRAGRSRPSDGRRGLLADAAFLILHLEAELARYRGARPVPSTPLGAARAEHTAIQRMLARSPRIVIGARAARLRRAQLEATYPVLAIVAA
jgi:hypothetical protein